MANAALIIDDNGTKVQGFAPNRIVSLVAHEELLMNEVLAVGSPLTYTYYINGDSANTMTRNGVIVRGVAVKTIAFTADITLEVM